jgi:hypothetical protein
LRQRASTSSRLTVGGDVEQFTRLFHDDYEKYARLMKDLKIKIN